MNRLPYRVKEESWIRLGSAICSERWESHLKLVGYHIYKGSRWMNHEGEDAGEIKFV